MLKKGDRGVGVRQLQSVLNRWIRDNHQAGQQTDLRPLSEDGAYGDNTSFVVRRFQLQNGLDNTGVVDEATASALGVSTEADSYVPEPDGTEDLPQGDPNGARLFRTSGGL